MCVESVYYDQGYSMSRADYVGGHVFGLPRQSRAKRKANGYYVIDRDGAHFKHILNFLCVGAIVALPTKAASKEELAIEAYYYGLQHFVRAIQMPQVDSSDILLEEVLAMRNKEHLMHKAFIDGSTGQLAQYRGLVSLFCPDNGVSPLPLKYDPVKDTSDDLMGNLRKKSSSDTPVTAKSLEDFQSNFNREHPNVLHRLVLHSRSCARFEA